LFKTSTSTFLSPGVINCDGFYCPTTTYKCVVNKITDETSTSTSKLCLDANGRVVDKEEENIPNLTSERSYRRSHAEADISGRVVVNNQAHGGQNYQTVSIGNQMSPDDIERLKRMQQTIHDYNIRLRDSIQSQVQETMNRIRGLQFPFVH
jgi:hypothetical protein